MRCVLCRFEDAFPGTAYDVVLDLIGGSSYELRRCEAHTGIVLAVSRV